MTSTYCTAILMAVPEKLELALELALPLPGWLCAPLLPTLPVVADEVLLSKLSLGCVILTGWLPVAPLG